ncbi:hypothetical protein [Streptomyces spiralis]|nr:hypothetical protein [Streptomyces spiralis]
MRLDLLDPAVLVRVRVVHGDRAVGVLVVQEQCQAVSRPSVDQSVPRRSS